MSKLRVIILSSLVMTYSSFAIATSDGFFSNLYNKISHYYSDKKNTEIDKKNLINDIRKKSLSGDYLHANQYLAEYKNKYGEDNSYLIEQARLLAFTNQGKKAAEILKPLIEKNPSDLTMKDISNYIALHPDITQSKPIITKDTSPKDTIQQYQQALVKNPNDKNSAIQLIQHYTINGDSENANKQLELYKEKNGEDDQYLTEKARYLAINHNAKQAIEIVNQLLQNNPNNKSLVEIKVYAEAHPDTVTSPEYNEAIKSLGEKNYKNAEINFKKSITIDPNDKAATIGLIRTYLFMGNYSDAKNTLKIYEKKFGVDTDYKIETARYYALSGQSKNAIQSIDPLLKEDPTNQTLLDIKKFAQENKTSKSAISPIKQANHLAAIAKSTRKNPELFASAAQAYSIAGDKINASEMIEQATRLAPTNLKYTKLKAEMAVLSGDYLTAYKTYKILSYKQPSNLSFVLELARAAAKLGKLDEAAHLYQAFLKHNSHEKQPWLEYAFIQSWRGNDRAAIRILDQYHSLFGNSNQYLSERARIIAAANRPRAALTIINPLMPVIPNDYNLNYAKTVALYYNNQPVEMFESLNRVLKLAPDTNETIGLAEFVRTPYRSNVWMDGYDSFDTDSVKIGHVALNGQYFTSPLTSIIGNITAERLSASINSGLNPAEGGNALALYGYNIGITHRFNQYLGIQATLGGQHAADGEGALTYFANAILKMNDTMTFDLLFKRQFYDVSPKAVSLGIKQNLDQLKFLWMPCIQCYVNATTAFSTFSDSNTKSFLEINPSAQFIATELFNVRFGVDGTWYRFSQQLNNGYYNPSNYKYYGFITNVYVKQSDNIGYEFSVGLGTQKDETFSAYNPANDYSAKAYLGIYRDWYLILSGGTSTRGRAIRDNPTLDTYQVYGFDATLTRRF